MVQVSRRTILTGLTLQGLSAVVARGRAEGLSLKVLRSPRGADSGRAGHPK